MGTTNKTTKPETSKENSDSKENLPAVIPQEIIIVQELLNLYESKNKIALIKRTSEIQTIDQIIEANTKTQISGCRKHDPENLEKLLKHMFLDLSKSFSISNNLNSDQIVEIVAEIICNWWWLTIEDLQLFLKMIRNGSYGLVISLDTNRILTWLKEYEKKKLDLIHYKRDNETYELSGPALPRVSIDEGIRIQHGITRAMLAMQKPKKASKKKK